MKVCNIMTYSLHKVHMYVLYIYSLHEYNTCILRVQVFKALGKISGQIFYMLNLDICAVKLGNK